MQDGTTREDDNLPKIVRNLKISISLKMLGRSVPLKIITSMTRTYWLPLEEVKYVGLGNGFMIIKFANKWNVYFFYHL